MSSDGLNVISRSQLVSSRAKTRIQAATLTLQHERRALDSSNSNSSTGDSKESVGAFGVRWGLQQLVPKGSFDVNV